PSLESSTLASPRSQTYWPESTACPRQSCPALTSLLCSTMRASHKYGQCIWIEDESYYVSTDRYRSKQYFVSRSDCRRRDYMRCRSSIYQDSPIQDFSYRRKT